MSSLRVRPPWSDPRLVYSSDLPGPGAARLLDLNRGFRQFLTARPFTRDLSRELRRTQAALERRREIQGSSLWSLYRTVRLSAALASLEASPARFPPTECLEEYFHYLATYDRWSFTRCVAYPHSIADGKTLDAESALDQIGDAFDSYVADSGLIEIAVQSSRVVIDVEDNGELPFAVRLVRLLKKGAPAVQTEVMCGAGLDARLVRALAARALPHGLLPEPSAPGPEIAPVLTRKAMIRAARFFRRSPGRLLSVVWRPRIARRLESKITRYLATLRSHGVPVALDFAPWIDEGTDPGDALFGAALDRLLDLQPSVADIRVHVRSVQALDGPLRADLALRSRDEELSDMLRVQLVAELDDVRLAPHRSRRKALTPRTRLEAARAYVVRSRFDLAAISTFLEPDKDARTYRLGRSRPLPRTPRFPRAARMARYLVVVGCPFVIPVSPADAGYTDALSFFARPRSVRDFAVRYGAENRLRVLAFLDLLVHNDVLGVA